ncbi:MAG: VCBS repeat-containing protein [Planctomycetes bacterium]|nr:VCBS repeat-containing protein [Planctomycetota bacterium]
MRAGLAVALSLAPLALAARVAAADGVGFGLYRCPAEGKVRAVRAVDADGDGRRDVVALVERKDASGAARQEVVVWRTPAAPVARTFFDPAATLRVACDGPEAGPRARAGAVALGRFADGGGVRLRFLGPDGIVDVAAADGLPTTTVPGASALARAPGAPLAFWDAVADLDRDGRDETWWPDVDGRVQVGKLVLPVAHEGRRGVGDLFVHHARTPSLTPADADGDGRLELVWLDGTTLVVERLDGGPATRVVLPFLAPDPARPPEELRAPRLSLADVDGDGRTDLVVTMVQGRADRLGGLRTSLYHYPGPFVAADGTLVEPRARIDTESVALHPRFVDVTGDGKLDYVADSIRGNVVDLIRRATGEDPEITYTLVRFDPATGTFEKAPYATFARGYSGAEARGNRFGRSGFFEGDFDGDHVKDLLDLGTLHAVAIWRGGRGEGAFEEALLKAVPVKDGALVADAVVEDLDGDGRTEAVVWTEDAILVVHPKGAS